MLFILWLILSAFTLSHPIFVRLRRTRDRLCCG